MNVVGVSGLANPHHVHLKREAAPADVTRGMTLQHLLLDPASARVDGDFVESLVDRVLLPVIRA